MLKFHGSGMGNAQLVKQFRMLLRKVICTILVAPIDVKGGRSALLFAVLGPKEGKPFVLSSKAEGWDIHK